MPEHSHFELLYGPVAPTSVNSSVSSVYKPQLFFNLELKTSRVAPSPI